MIRILELERAAGPRCAKDAPVSLVWLDRLTPCLFAMATWLRTYVDGTLCSGDATICRQKRRGSIGSCFVVSGLYTISFV